MENRKKTFGRKALSFVLAACMLVTTFAPTMATVAYAEDAGTSLVTSSVPTVDEGNAVKVDDTGTATQPEADSSADDKSDANSNSQPPDSSSSSSATDSSSSSTTDSSSSSSSDSSDASSSESQGQDTDSSVPTDPDSGSDSSSEPTEGEDASSSEPSSEPEEGEGTGDEDTEENPAEEFVALTVMDPETGATIIAEVGDEVTLNVGLNRDDVAVGYQWQRMQLPLPEKEIEPVEPVFDYPEGSPTWYAFPLEGVTESEALSQNPDAEWNGIEMYFAAVEALDAIGADSSNVSFAWKTPNYALDGYEIIADNTDGTVKLYAEKDDQRYTAVLNAEGKFEFSETAEATPESIVENTWVDVEGATESSYTFTVTEEDHYAQYRLKVTILDEEYLSKCIEILEEQGVELTEEQKAEQQSLYSVVMQVESAIQEEDFAPVETDAGTMAMASFFAVDSKPYLSEDGQWICGLTNEYQYITEDTYNRIMQWYKDGVVTDWVAINRYWTSLGEKGWKSTNKANVLDENGMPTGEIRIYNGFNLTDGKLEVASEWYGKTVYFRVAGSSNYTPIKIPAYTELTGVGDKYDEAASGTKYKKAITLLNPYPADTPAMYGNFISFVSKNGWLLERNENGDFTNNLTDNHIRVYALDAVSFNADPQRYMVDAEGNYRMDSVAWGVCTGQEPDISGKAYWVLKDFINEGYGFLTGHDTMYAYPGAYYDALGVDMDESSIDPNDGTTWYYDINSWMPGTTATDPNGNKSTTRGGHFYMNELMGTNAGNVYSETVVPSDAPSLILSTGGSHGIYGKMAMYGSEQLNVVQIGFSAELAKQNPRYRTPTNYPYAFSIGETQFGKPLTVPLTHTNGQAAFGNIWVNYTGENLGSVQWGGYKDPLYWTIDGKTGTNNFYLTGDGNYLMNQIGHLPTNAASAHESTLFANSVMYVSQRKQCEICAANQHNQQTSHFVRRVSAANSDAVLTALQNGGSYWYPIDGCYQLTEDIELPEDWTPIKGFKGHWNSDVYDVTLNSKGTPLLANDSADGLSGWNLGTDKNKGTVNVFDENMNRSTGVARVLGDLNDLFGTTNYNYAGYVVKFLGTDNPKYMQPGEEYTCTVNTDSKYVVSNLPCVYNELGRFGVLNARVYKPDGTEVTEYGTIRANVPVDFWDNDMTTPLYLGSFGAEPANDYTTYESAQSIFKAVGVSSDNLRVDRWEYSTDAGKTWQTVPEDWDYTLNNVVQEPGTEVGEADNYIAYTTLTLNKTNPAWDGYKFRAVFANDHGEWNSYCYYWKGGVASNTQFSGSKEEWVAKTDMTGTLSVNLWPAYAEQSPDQTVNESDSATFRAYGLALDDGTKISVRWQYSTPKYVTSGGEEVFDWHYIDEDNEFGGIQTINTKSPVETTPTELDYALHGVAPNNNLDLFHEKAKFHGVETKLTVNKVDITQSGTHFRAEFKATTEYGTEYIWYSNIADDFNGSWDTDSGNFGNFKREAVENNSNEMKVIPPDLNLVTTKSADFTEGAVNQDLMTPDEYGQTLLLKTLTSSVANGTAVYRAEIYYRPTEMKPEAAWQYMTYQDRVARPWSTEVANALGYGGVKVGVVNSDPVPATLNGEGNWMMYTSTMTISNAPLSMYNPETLLKYYFRCVATTSYTTVRGTKNLASTDKWGGLTMDYAIALWHNGVMEYDNTNIVNGTTVTDAKGLQVATAGHEYSDWYYPKLSIRVPNGHHVNTAIVYFDETAGFNSKDSLIVNTAAIQALGISVQENTGKKIVLVSTTANTVEIETWQKALREYIGFRSYDSGADYSYDKVVSGTTGGGGVKWVVDEARLAGLVIDPATGHAYKLVTWSNPVEWSVAKQEAQKYNQELQMSGRLVEISDAKENEIVKAVAGGRNVWLGGYNRGGSFYWDSNAAPVSYLPWISGAKKGNANLYMTSNGQWNSGPVDKTETKTYTKNFGGTNWAVASGNGHLFITSSTVNIAPAAYQIDVAISAWSNDTARDCFWRADYYSNGWKRTNEYATMDNHNRVLTFNGNITAVNVTAIQHATAIPYTSQVKIDSVTAHIKETVVVKNNPVYAAVIEYVPQSLGMVVTDHSATDDAVVGTDAVVPDEKPGQIVVDIDGDAKIYDGTPIYPSKFEVSGPDGANRNLFDITYTAIEPDNHADYTETTVRGGDYQNSGAVNATKYHAKLTLTQEAIDDGWVIDEANSQLECDLVIYPRPINVYSYNNAKIYDGSSAGIIKDIQFSGMDAVSGVIPGDNVQLTTTTVMGSYVNNEGQLETHNSKTNNGGNEYKMTRNAKISPLDILHNETSDPHYNYVLGTETYTGPINQKGLYVHSLYLEDKDNPRNVKTYDGNNTATIRDILIDGIVAGDKIGLKQPTMNGTYATANAGEKLDSNGQALPDRLTKLDENIITATEKAELTGNDFGDYFIEREEYSGAICRALLEVIVSNHRYMYGSEGPGYPTYDDVYRPNVPSDSWMKVDGLQGNDILDLDENFTLAAKDKNGTQIEFTDRTPVGVYPVVPEGLTETNYPVLGNYLVSIVSGRVEVYPREIVITTADTDWYVKDEGIPQTHAIFEMVNDDGETYKGIGNDADNEYADIKLIGEDTIANTILVGGVAPTKDAEASAKEFGTGDTRKTVFQNGSNLPYTTPWYVGAPAVFLDIESDTTLYPCEWCENYHGFEMGTEHWRIGGYNLTINQDPESGNTLDVVEVENLLGEMVKNYTISYVDGQLRVHPELRFQLKATVPLEVCMYGYAGDGEVVEPENYGITNYSNGAIQITDIEVKDDGWNIVDKAPAELLRGEMTMKMNDTQLVVGHNKPRNPDQWVIKADESEDDSGVQMLIPMTCYIAGGNVNEKQETYITHVTYTIAEYGVTVPEIDGVELPDFINGKPVTVDKNS